MSLPSVERMTSRLELDVPAPTGPDAGILARTARWSNGPDHASRRSAVLDVLREVSAADAASAAGRAMAAWLCALPYDQVDVLPVFRTIPLTVLSTLITDDEDDGDAVTGILVQSRDATAALACARLTGATESPVRWTKRVDAGVVVSVPLSASTWFGAGAHACPGRELATAMADAMAEAVLERWAPVPVTVVDDPALPHLRLPLEVLVERR